MSTVKKLILYILFILISISQSKAQDSSSVRSKPFSFEASYIGEVASNFTGGIKAGTTYLGLANLAAGFDTQKAGWWKGGEFRINAANTHGGEPSANLVGDFQGVSNIEAGNLTFLYELWYKQVIDNLSLTVGLQDLNTNFAKSQNGSIFTNSSFGIHSSIADNIPSPIYPLTALGATLQWNVPGHFNLQTAIFDGTPDDFENNPYNTDWKLSKNDGFLTVMEIQFPKSMINGLAGCYKIGSYYHQHNDTIDLEQQNYGFYFDGDQDIYKTANGMMSVFSQIGISPKKENKNNFYYSLGFHFSGISAKRKFDETGIAIAYAGFGRTPSRNETAIELTYRIHVNETISLKPDLQYFINPSGTDAKLKNALTGLLRVELNF